MYTWLNVEEMIMMIRIMACYEPDRDISIVNASIINSSKYCKKTQHAQDTSQYKHLYNVRIDIYS